MLKSYIITIYNKLIPLYKTILSNCILLKNKTTAYFQYHITSWWQVAIGVLFAIAFLYYPIGGMLVHNIDTSSTYKPLSKSGKLSSIDMMSYLINREAHYNIWTPNLPFLFPSFFLDNMPSFQLGLMSAISKTALALNHLTLLNTTEEARKQLNEGVDLLQYPGDIWLFSPQTHLPAPSSASQYKKGRKKLNNFNNEIKVGRANIDMAPQNLSVFLHVIKNDINVLITKTEKHIRENNDSAIDVNADNVFYYAQGKLYAYSQILKSLGIDFKTVMITKEIYPQWTSVIKALQNASDINPSIVRNGKLDSIFAPNHLIAINYFATQTINKLNRILNKLDKKMDNLP